MRLAPLALILAVPALAALPSCGAVVARIDHYDRNGSLALFGGSILDAHLAAGIESDVVLMMPQPSWLWRPAAVLDFVPSLALDIDLAPLDWIVYEVTKPDDLPPASQ